jgi:hypothetical protein
MLVVNFFRNGVILAFSPVFADVINAHILL